MPALGKLDASVPRHFGRGCWVELTTKPPPGRDDFGFSSIDGLRARKMSFARCFLSACDGVRGLLDRWEDSRELTDSLC